MVKQGLSRLGWLLAGSLTLVTAMALPAEYEDVLGFDMWCLDMQQYPAARCDTRRAADVKDYERYRASQEQYEQQRVARAKREQALKDRLNRNPSDTKR